MTDREKLIEAMARAMHDARPPMDVEGKLLDFDDPANCTSMNCTHDAAAALSAIEAMGATVVPVEIDDETAVGIWRAAYDEWAEFGSLDRDAGRAAHREIIAASPFAKGSTDDK